MSRVRVREARMRARHVGVVVARLPRRPPVPSRQRPALADQYVVVASMSLRIPISYTLVKLPVHTKQLYTNNINISDSVMYME